MKTFNEPHTPFTVTVSCYLKANVLQQFKVFCIHPEVFQDFRVVHVVGVISRDGEVTVAHHLLGNVDGKGAVDASPVWIRNLLQIRGFT